MEQLKPVVGLTTEQRQGTATLLAWSFVCPHEGEPTRTYELNTIGSRFINEVPGEGVESACLLPPHIRAVPSRHWLCLIGSARQLLKVKSAEHTAGGRRPSGGRSQES